MKVDVYYQANVKHLLQIYTGLQILRKKGAVSIRQRLVQKAICKKKSCLRQLENLAIQPHHLLVLINERTLCLYDVKDGNYVDPDLASCVDYYFKRTYLDPDGKYPKNVLPLGLNYEVHPNGIDWLHANRSFATRKGLGKIRGVMRAFNLTPKYKPRLDDFEADKNGDKDDTKIMFYVRAWNPCDCKNNTIAKEGRHKINEMRAECIRRLRSKFNDNFIGGFIPTDYAKKQYHDCLSDRPENNQKKNYLGLVKEHSICIATEGLHQSIGGKFAEYVAFGRSIVSEKFKHKIPGGFEEGKNYLSFETPDECIEKCEQLFNKKELRDNLRKNNLAYYNQYLRPDRLVQRTLDIATSDIAPIAS